MSLSGKPAINDPRQAPRELQEVVRAIRQRLVLAEALVNSLKATIDNLQTSTTTTAVQGAAGAPGSIQFNAGGALAGVGGLTWDNDVNRLGVQGVLNLDPDSQPAALIDGDVWTTALGLYAIISGNVRGPFLDGQDLVAGTNVVITPLSGGGYEISASIPGGGVSSINGESGAITLQAGSNITITPQSGGAFVIASTGGGGSVTILPGVGISVNTLTGDAVQINNTGVLSIIAGAVQYTGDVTLQAGANVTFTPLSGNVLEIAATAGFSAFELYRADTSSTSGTGIASGEVRWNNATQNLASQIFVSHIDDHGVDIGLFLSLVSAGTTVVIQDRDNDLIYQRFEITSAVDNGTYFTFGVTALDSAGGNIPNNHNIVLLFNTVGQTNAVTDVNGLTGSVTFEAGSNVTLTVQSGNVIRISASGGGGGGVTSLNGEVGAVTLAAGANVTITQESGGVIRIAASAAVAAIGLDFLVGIIPMIQAFSQYNFVRT